MKLYSSKNMSMLESILRNHGFSLRYEKGNFQSGYCVLQDKKVVIVNKFFDKAGRFRVLTELLREIPLDPELLNEEEIEILDKIVPGWTTAELFAENAEINK
ncbi:MAG: hypothetical protein R3275_07630 [Saprospiraceae bacterium]|nr:hypothetical protein [Saprospiraceae bacterium]